MNLCFVVVMCVSVRRTCAIRFEQINLRLFSVLCVCDVHAVAHLRIALCEAISADNAIAH